MTELDIFGYLRFPSRVCVIFEAVGQPGMRGFSHAIRFHEAVTIDRWVATCRVARILGGTTGVSMTHTRQMADHEGDFGTWGTVLDSATGQQMRCPQPVEANYDIGRMQAGWCGALVECRRWESSDGAYEDHQYRCANGHKWWIDGIDS